ncbi:MAG: MBL fold metallo-hydrolase [Deltaproteobacteria bacterium]|nr:MBL fold metallo-hydrolase [Deltaproteobacteria bacterium]
MRFCVLGSGSKGNAIWVESSQDAILLDAGLSWKRIRSRLIISGLDERKLRAIIVSHEHIDHLRGAGPAARAAHVPVFATSGTFSAWASDLEKRASKPCLETIEPGRAFNVSGFLVTPFSTSHDVNQPVMFRVEDHFGASLGVATDLGVATRLVKDRLADCNALVLEFNHDPDMLMDGPYPWPLKQRIRSRLGHLSNPEAADLLADLLHPGLDLVVLAHLSEMNNDPRLALNAAGRVLSNGARLLAAHQDTPTPVFTVGSSDLSSKDKKNWREMP